MMTDSKHTPGPWFAKGRYIGTKNDMSHIGECRDINGNWSDDAKSSGNAALIASAPELLEALREATLALDGLAKGEGVFKPIEQTIVLARAAIAKAEAK